MQNNTEQAAEIQEQGQNNAPFNLSYRIKPLAATH
jgi:hypothetical protein